MQSLRNVRSLARLMLAWFVLSLCVASAAPAFAAPPPHDLCTSDGGLKAAGADDQGTHSADDAGAHCPLCLLLAGPPTPQLLPATLPQPGGARPIGVATAPAVSAAAAPLPARGPPHLH
jgi:hypothetical protein